MITWTPIDSEHLPNGFGKLLVTNNISARNANDHWSHVWLVDMLHFNEHYQVFAYGDYGHIQPSFLTHYIRLELVLKDALNNPALTVSNQIPRLYADAAQFPVGSPAHASIMRKIGLLEATTPAPDVSTSEKP